MGIRQNIGDKKPVIFRKDHCVFRFAQVLKLEYHFQYNRPKASPAGYDTLDILTSCRTRHGLYFFQEVLHSWKVFG